MSRDVPSIVDWYSVENAVMIWSRVEPYEGEGPTREDRQRKIQHREKEEGRRGGCSVLEHTR